MLKFDESCVELVKFIEEELALPSSLGSELRTLFDEDPEAFFFVCLEHVSSTCPDVNLHESLTGGLFSALADTIALNKSYPNLHAYAVETGKSALRENFTKSKPSEYVTKSVLRFLLNALVEGKENFDSEYMDLYNVTMSYFLNKKYIYEVPALLYNLHLKYPEIKIQQEFLEFVLGEETKETTTNEYILFLMELFFKRLDFWTQYLTLDVKYKILVLRSLYDPLSNKKVEIPDVAIEILCNNFCTFGDLIFESASKDDEDLEVTEIVLTIQFLASLSSDEEYLKQIQSDTNVIVHACTLLMTMHRLGKDSDNYFSMVQKLFDLKSSSMEELNNHPAFGLKADLIRLIGNLCWQCKAAQDMVRHADVIPVILDCCNIDARNPFIMQWVILAVRNLCEKNEANQNIIASLHKEGTINNANLDQLGLVLHKDEKNSIGIVELKNET